MGILKKLLGTPAGWEEAVAYDTYGAPTASAATILGAAKGGRGVTYDAAGRIVTKTETPWGPGTAKVWTYTYDAAGRLASALVNGVTTTYDYDANGNRAGATVDAQDRVTSQGDTSYIYDAHGNVLTRTVTGGAAQTLTWDTEGGLLSVTPGNIEYVIDAYGRRAGKRLAGKLVREWMYDGQLRVVGEIVRDPGTEAVTRRRVYGYVPERHLPIVMVEAVDGGAPATYRIYGDHLGSLRTVVDASGLAVQRMSHDAWGQVLPGSDVVVAPFERVPFGFAGGLYDADTGLVRFGAREYDAGTGRWLSKDEARFGGGGTSMSMPGGTR